LRLSLRLSARLPFSRLVRAGAALLAVSATATATVSAQTLQETLVSAYTTSPTLEAARAALRATDEGVAQARSGWRPTITGQASAERNWTDTATGTSGGVGAGVGLGTQSGLVVSNNTSVSASLNQPLYRGGRTTAAIRQAEATVEAGRSNLVDTEQTLLLNAVTAHMNVVRDRAVLDLNGNNETVLQQQLQATRDRFTVGEVTQTDVSQSESRLAAAAAARVAAAGTLEASLAAYEQIVGRQASAPRFPETIALALPESEAAAIEQALANNPAVAEAEAAARAAEAAVRVAFGRLLPDVSLTGSASRSDNSQGRIESIEAASFGARATVPLYQGGAEHAQVRAAKQTAEQRRQEAESVRRQVTENAVRAWNGIVTARASIEARQSQVRAADIALEGVRQEAMVGSRTTLDVLDQEQERLNARVELVRAERDQVVAAYALLAATGRLTAESLGLPVDLYRPDAHYARVRGQWFGTGID
jgi:outer membrane protein/adhesin transport system outer membrane protein